MWHSMTSRTVNNERDSDGAARRGVCLVLSAPSGAGKSSVLHALTREVGGLANSVSVTTRRPRTGERDGVDYHFLSSNEFEEQVRIGALLEHATVFGRGYGTPRSAVEETLASGQDVVLDIDWQGWRQLRAAMPDDSVGVFLLPPSLAVLSDRLRGRGSDEVAEVERRMVAARREISHWREFDHVVVNDDLTLCVAEVKAVLQAARCTTRRSIGAARLADAMARAGLE